MFLIDLALGDGDVARQPRLRRQQIVEAAIETPLIDVVSDGEQIAGRVEEERKVHVSQFLAAVCSPLESLNAVGGTLRSIDDRLPQLTEPGDLRRVVGLTIRRNNKSPNDSFQSRKQRRLHGRNLAQARRTLHPRPQRIELVECLEVFRRLLPPGFVGRGRQFRPRGQVQ
jgi:hypothetical protein